MSLAQYRSSTVIHLIKAPVLDTDPQNDYQACIFGGLHCTFEFATMSACKS